VSPSVAKRIGVVKALVTPRRMHPMTKTTRFGAQAQSSAAAPKVAKPTRIVPRRKVRSEMVPEKNWQTPKVTK
jgi:hypothetical protein